MTDPYGNKIELAGTERITRIPPEVSKKLLSDVLQLDWCLVTDLSCFGDFQEEPEEYSKRIEKVFKVSMPILESTLLVDAVECIMRAMPNQ